MKIMIYGMENQLYSLQLENHAWERNSSKQGCCVMSVSQLSQLSIR